MAFSQTELDTLKQAYATGILQVRVDGKLVQYDDGAALLRRIRVIEAELAIGSGASRPVAGYAWFSRGRT